MALHWHDDGPTLQSISDARHAMWEERAAVERQTGIRLSDTGRVIAIGCPYPRCTWVSKVRRDGPALKSLVAHIRGKHAGRTKEN